jgi:hypothetical protein
VGKAEKSIGCAEKAVRKKRLELRTPAAFDLPVHAAARKTKRQIAFRHHEN